MKYLKIGIISICLLIVFFLVYKSEKSDIKIYSEVLDETRRILVHLPDGYEKTGKKYPVLFLLDGGDVKIHSVHITPFSQAVQTLKRLDDARIPQLILVGIANTDRARDMIPVKTELYPSSGGAENFKQFIQRELIPYIDKYYRTKPFRIFYGRSDSGLFAAYSFLKDPALFNGYIIASPSIGLFSDFIRKRTEEMIKQIQKTKQSLYLTYFSSDSIPCNQGILPFIDMLKKKQLHGLGLKVEVVEGTGHIPLDSLQKGLEFIFQ